MRHTASKPWAAGLVATAAGLLLSACSDGLGPGVAAEVAGEQISTSEVDDLAALICEIDKGADQAGTPIAAQRATALTVLLGIEVGRRIGDVDAVPQQVVTQSLQAASEARALVPEDLQDYFDEIIRDSTRSAAAVDAVAASNLREAGRQPEPAAVQAEVARLQQTYLEERPVEVAPRFGVYQDGQVVSGDGSLSVAVSDRARSLMPQGTDAGAAQPAADLPASQVCG